MWISLFFFVPPVPLQLLNLSQLLFSALLGSSILLAETGNGEERMKLELSLFCC